MRPDKAPLPQYVQKKPPAIRYHVVPWHQAVLQPRSSEHRTAVLADRLRCSSALFTFSAMSFDSWDKKNSSLPRRRATAVAGPRY